MIDVFYCGEGKVIEQKKQSNIYRIMGFNPSILTLKFTGETPLIKESPEVGAKKFGF